MTDTVDVEACVRPDIPWRCFHCDETFTDADAAREHFGVDEGQVAGCILKLNEGERLLLGTIRELQQENRDLLQRAQEAEMEHEMDAGLRTELKRYFGHSDAWSCWQEMDAMKGRALAAEEMIQRLLTAANAPAAEYLCDRVDALASALPGMGKDSDEFREACRAGGIACAGEREAARDEGRLDDARRWGRFAEILHARVGANR